MAVVNCRECGKSVSTEAAACPHCGAPQGQQPASAIGQPPAKPKKKMGCLAWIGLGLLALFVIGMFATPKDDKGQASTAASSATTAATPAAPAIAVTANELFAAYQANEVSADQLYKDKKLAVSGTVQEIKKDFTDSIYVVLKTPNPFMGVHASLDDKHQGVAASLQKGQKVAWTCTGAGMVVGSPMLRKCEP